MAELSSNRVWLGRAFYLLVALLLIFLSLLPMQTTPRAIAPPDLLLAVTLGWTVRRPEVVPITFVAAIFLMTDLLFQRPPGLYAGLVVILTEVLRHRSKRLRNFTFTTEWLSVGLGMIALMLGYRILLLVAMVPAPPLGLTLIQLLLTILTYPIVIMVSHFAFGVSRPAPGEVDSLGHRL